jgi:hypothetical protein
MSLQNRVDPWGALNSVPSKAATLMGNRGILHDEQNNILRPWAHKGWVFCMPSFKGIKRPKPFSQGNYSELFFLDEATAFAAGHRPCAYCQRKRFQEFKEAWLGANLAEEKRASMTMPTIDKVLHGERAIRGGGKQVYEATLSDLPFGTMFDFNGKAFVVGKSVCYPWAFDGYGPPMSIDETSLVMVLTPQSVVRTFAGGFTPLLHLSARGGHA